MQSSNKCTRERITDALLAHRLTGQEAVDMAGWLAGLRELPHLDALTLGEVQHVMGRIEDAQDMGGLIAQWRAALNAIPLPTQQEGEQWLYWS